MMTTIKNTTTKTYICVYIHKMWCIWLVIIIIMAMSIRYDTFVSYRAIFNIDTQQRLPSQASSRYALPVANIDPS